MFTSDPYFRIYSLNDRILGKKGIEGYKLVYQSEYKKNNLNPKWGTTRLDRLEKSYNFWKFVNDWNNPDGIPAKESVPFMIKNPESNEKDFLIEIMDHDDGEWNEDDFMGKTYLTFQELIRGGEFRLFKKNSEDPVVRKNKYSVLKIETKQKNQHQNVRRQNFQKHQSLNVPSNRQFQPQNVQRRYTISDYSQGRDREAKSAFRSTKNFHKTA